MTDDRRTDRLTTTMTTARPLLKYGRLKWHPITHMQTPYPLRAHFMTEYAEQRLAKINYNLASSATCSTATLVKATNWSDSGYFMGHRSARQLGILLIVRVALSLMLVCTDRRRRLRYVSSKLRLSTCCVFTLALRFWRIKFNINDYSGSLVA